MPRSWDIFCRVIDNFGDAAVCWRLARQLADEHDAAVRLWIDALAPLHALCPEIAADRAEQVVSGVDVRSWTGNSDFGRPADIVIEAFGCGLPESFVEAMATRNPAPLWIILEYLSAESWVVSHHGLPSPHPRLPLQRNFFFPGLVPGTGGVLKEATLDARCAAFEGSPADRAGFWAGLGFDLPGEQALTVSLFGYENPGVEGLLKVWADGTEPVVVAVPRSRVRAQVCAFFGSADPGDGAVLKSGSLEARFLPFLPQPGYDELLWACDWNFARGEDSFVRAQWARRPFVWHIYPQQDHAHRVKLDAFLAVYCTSLEPKLADALRSLWHYWNAPGQARAGQPGAAWHILETRRQELDAHARAWAGRLAQAGDLAANLAQYCEERLK